MTKEQMIQINRLLHSLSDDLTYRIGDQAPSTEVFFRDFAESLEALAKRVRRGIKS